jgi:hypothetical protein
MAAPLKGCVNRQRSTTNAMDGLDYSLFLAGMTELTGMSAPSVCIKA